MQQKYELAVEKIDKEKFNLDCLDEIEEKFKTKRIKCYKYNYNIDEKVQNFRQFEAYLSLSKDGTQLIITNMKPISNPEYVLEADPNVVERLRQEN